MNQSDAICPKCNSLNATVTESEDERMVGTVVVYLTKCGDCGHEESVAIRR